MIRTRQYVIKWGGGGGETDRDRDRQRERQTDRQTESRCYAQSSVEIMIIQTGKCHHPDSLLITKCHLFEGGGGGGGGGEREEDARSQKFKRPKC